MIELDRMNLGLVHQHNYDPAVGTYTIHRIYGICSNILVALHGLAKVISLGHRPSKIVFKPAEYIQDADIYKTLFEFVERAPGRPAAALLANELYPSAYGLSQGWQSFNKEVLGRHLLALQDLMHYFSPSWNVKDQMLKLTSIEDIDPQKTVFIWARGTDKTKESELPSPAHYLSIAKNVSHGNQIIVQTDDIQIARAFEADPTIKVLKHMPFSDQVGFHERLCNMSDIDFIKKNYMTRHEYIAKFYATLLVAAQCSVFIGYPGNLTTMVPILRGSFNGCYLFKNKFELI